MRYGFIIRTSDGSCTVSKCETRKEAVKSCLDFAIASGWKPPKWWEFWRYNETKMKDINRILQSETK